MTSSTNRHTPPAAPTRTGRCGAALPNDPGLDAILADPDLSSTAKALITVMVKNWAWSKDHCWPSDRTLAAKVGKSVGQVQRCLHELEQAGRIQREKTDAVPNGRRIWLLWRCPGGRTGAQRQVAKARSTPAAPARSEQIVVVNEGSEREIQCAPRSRPEVAPTANAVPDPMASQAAALLTAELTAPPMPSPAAQEPRGTPLTVAMDEPTPSIAQASPEATGGLPGDPAAPPVPTTSANALDLRGLGRPTLPVPATPIPCSAPAASWTSPWTSRRKRLGLGLNVEELARIVAATGDPILAAELARCTAPPPPPEPSPEAVPTAELLAKLPGRHDWIAVATHRLAEATGDFKAASWSFFRQTVEAVVTRTVPAEVLVDCLRQATGPKAVNAGKVFVVAWKREVALRC
jgi:Helix-turn-helix domain